MTWTTPSSTDYVLGKAKAPDDSAAIGSFWIGEQPRDDSGVWEAHNSLYSGRSSDGGVTRRTQWKKVAEPAWKKAASTSQSSSSSSSSSQAKQSTTSAPSQSTSATNNVTAAATEARDRATSALDLMSSGSSLASSAPASTTSTSSADPFSGGSSGVIDPTGSANSVFAGLMSNGNKSEAYTPRFNSFLKSAATKAAISPFGSARSNLSSYLWRK